MTHLTARPGILKIAPYKQGASEVDGITSPIKLSSNESPLGPSPRAIAAYEKAAAELFRYPDGSQHDLIAAIAGRFDLPESKLICGNGSDELIQMLIRAYVGPEDEIIISEQAFAMCRVHALAQGATVVTAPEPDLVADVDQILALLTPHTRMVALASPNNPAGRYLTKTELHRLHENLPENILLLVDSAYADYVEAEDYDPGLMLANTTKNVVMTRTFSKLYGLSALRIGWALCHESIIDILQRIRTPFNTNAPALAAAEQAILDVAYETTVRAHNTVWLEKLSATLTDLGIEVIPSVANFILMRFPNDPAKNAESAWRFLLSKGIIPRPVGAGGPANCLRVTIGLDSENEAVIAALSEFMKR
ncbi:histidinol-phosphate transaminase [Paremcibacter congregatus]|uniref:histidinol-phosphate transaminase n=1 Tax=Paremcibacter congregatus TaxID=2043170 RepID=UPI003A8ECE5D|tara:strand:- start:3776 stop:4867 length:1092 start_codon:yes stop_codon:yes gene_type:complete